MVRKLGIKNGIYLLSITLLLLIAISHIHSILSHEKIKNIIIEQNLLKNDQINLLNIKNDFQFLKLILKDSIHENREISIREKNNLIHQIEENISTLIKHNIQNSEILIRIKNQVLKFDSFFEKHNKKPLTKDEYEDAVKISNLIELWNDDLFRNIQTKIDILEPNLMSHMNHNILLIWIFLIISLVLGIYFSLKIQNGINQPIEKLSSTLNSISEQNKQSSLDLKNSSFLVSHSVADQAIAIKDTLTSMKGMENMVSKTIHQATESQISAREVADKAELGRAAMNEMLQAMEKIYDSSSRLQSIEKAIGEISEKANIINKIVDKTQLLSFNASIEAARAGAHGKGFAVVAHEVGNLANLSGQAANEIKDLLKQSQLQVAEVLQGVAKSIAKGQEVSFKANQVFEIIAQEIDTITAEVSDVKEASDEQRLGIEQISSSLQKMEELTLKNTKAVEENKKLSELLLEHSQQLAMLRENLNLLAGNKDYNVVSIIKELPQSSNTATLVEDSTTKIDLHSNAKESSYEKIMKKKEQYSFNKKDD